MLHIVHQNEVAAEKGSVVSNVYFTFYCNNFIALLNVTLFKLDFKGNRDLIQIWVITKSTFVKGVILVVAYSAKRYMWTEGRLAQKCGATIGAALM